MPCSAWMERRLPSKLKGRHALGIYADVHIGLDVGRRRMAVPQRDIRHSTFSSLSLIRKDTSASVVSHGSIFFIAEAELLGCWVVCIEIRSCQEHMAFPGLSQLDEVELIHDLEGLR